MYSSAKIFLETPPSFDPSIDSKWNTIPFAKNCDECFCFHRGSHINQMKWSPSLLAEKNIEKKKREKLQNEIVLQNARCSMVDLWFVLYVCDCDFVPHNIIRTKDYTIFLPFCCCCLFFCLLLVLFSCDRSACFQMWFDLITYSIQPFQRCSHFSSNSPVVWCELMVLNRATLHTFFLSRYLYLSSSRIRIGSHFFIDRV